MVAGDFIMAALYHMGDYKRTTDNSLDNNALVIRLIVIKTEMFISSEALGWTNLIHSAALQIQRMGMLLMEMLTRRLHNMDQFRCY